MADSLSGVYAIVNKVDGKQYIVGTKNVYSNMEVRRSELLNGRHDNKELQEAVNTYGSSSFGIKILEMTKDYNERKRQIMESIPPEMLYNHNKPPRTASTADADMSAFLEYVDQKWSIPEGSDRNEFRDRWICRDDNMNEIVDLAIRYNIMDVYPSQVTMIRVLKMIEDIPGYMVESHRCKRGGKRDTYKLIIKKDSNK